MSMSVLVQCYMPFSMAQRVQAYAVAGKLNQSTAIRVLIAAGLDAEGAPLVPTPERVPHGRNRDYLAPRKKRE